MVWPQLLFTVTGFSGNGPCKPAMNIVDNIRSHLVSGFVYICIAVIAVSMVFIAYSRWSVPLSASLIAGLVMALILTIWHKQTMLARSLQDQHELQRSFEALERDVFRRLDELSLSIEGGDKPSARNLLPQIAELSQQLSYQRTEIATLTLRMEKAQPAASQPQPSDVNVVPLRKSECAPKKPVGEGKKPKAPTKPAEPPRVLHQGKRPAKIAKAGSMTDAAPVLHLQPIVELGSGEPAFYEASRLIRHDETADIAAQGGVVTFDEELIFEAVRMLRVLEGMNRKTRLICRLPGSLLEQDQRYEDIRSFLDANAPVAGSLVLAFDGLDWDQLNDNGLERIAAITDLGYSLCLNQINPFGMSGQRLERRGFEFIKVPAAVILATAVESGLNDELTDFIAAMNVLGIEMIVTDIDRETAIFSLIDHGIPFGMGNHFSPPRPVKGDLLGKTKPGLSKFGAR